MLAKNLFLTGVKSETPTFDAFFQNMTSTVAEAKSNHNNDHVDNNPWKADFGSNNNDLSNKNNNNNNNSANAFAVNSKNPFL